MSTTIEVVEYTDPGCVWSWGSEPQLRRLRHHYGAQLAWRRVLGLQVDRLEQTHPGLDPVADAETFRTDWLAVAENTRAPVPTALAWMHRSTRPAAAAVHAAARQGSVAADRVLRRLREAVFVVGRPADDPARLAEALRGTDGVDLDRLLAELDDPAVLASVRADAAEARAPHPSVVGRTGPGPNPGAARPDGAGGLRYGFPTLLVRGPGGEEVVSGWLTADDLEAALLHAGARPIDSATPLDPDTALARYRTLTVRDLELLTGGREPLGATVIPTATTPVWAHPDEAERLLGATAAATA
jgi:predicted DsbA family dithiol-disulfide isomerase